MKNGEINQTRSKNQNEKLTVIFEPPDCPNFIPNRPQPHPKSSLSRFFHWGPILAVSIIIHIGLATCFVHLQWWPLTSFTAWLNMAIFLFWNLSTLRNLYMAAFIGPGYVPLAWKPPYSSQEFRLQWCGVCQGYKCPRSHHCRKCQRCVMKMDHHCPWINNCTGHFNHGFFIRFLLFAVFGCLHASIILSCSIYRAIFRVWYLYYGTGREPIVEFDLYGLIFVIFAFGLAVGVVFSIGFLLFIQLKSIYRNRTGIEDYIVDKAKYRDSENSFIYPYDLGCKRNFQEVLGTWNGFPIGNGFWWPIAADCDQFTFTEEQKAQKELKMEKSRVYAIVRPYSGRICTFWNGCATFYCQPYTDDPRISVVPGQHYLITRGIRHWLYGDLITVDETKNDSFLHSADIGINRRRGWFPRSCGRRLDQVLVMQPFEGKKSQ